MVKTLKYLLWLLMVKLKVAAKPQQASSPPLQKIEVQQEHNEDKKPVAVASLSGCVCKDYDLIWGAKVNCAFRKKVIE